MNLHLRKLALFLLFFSQSWAACSFWPCDVCDGFILLDYMYLKGKNGNDILAHTHTDSCGKSKTQIKRIDYDWDDAYSLGIGYRFPCSSWYLKLHFQEYRSDNKIQFCTFKEEGVGTELDPIAFGPVDLSDTLEEAFHAKGQLHLYTLKLTAERLFCFDPDALLIFRMGLQASWIYQNLHYTFDILDIGNTTEIFSRFDSKDNMKTIGPTLGLEGVWFWGCNLGVYGSFDGSLLWGTHNLRTKINEISDNPFFGETCYRDDYLFPYFRYEVGLQWSGSIVCGKVPFSIKAGWLTEYFFDQNFFSSVQFGESFGGVPFGRAIALQGLILTAQIAF